MTTVKSPESHGRVGAFLEVTHFSVAPGSSVAIPCILLNRGTVEDFFEVSVIGIPGTWVSISTPVVEIFPGEKKEVVVNIEVPNPPEGRAGHYPFTIQATSQSEHRQKADVGGVLTVAAFEVKGRIGVLLDSTQFSVTPGNDVNVPLILVNQGVTEDHLSLSVEGIPASWVSTSSPITRLSPGEQKEVTLTIMPPRASEAHAGRNRFKIRIVSREAPDQTLELDCALTVAAYSHFLFEINPQRVAVGQPVQLTVRNLGNIQEAYTLALHSQADALVFEPAVPRGLRVAPGDTAVAQFLAVPRRRPLIGGEVTYAYTAQVRSAEKAVQTLNGEVVTRALIPVWVLPAMLVICLAFVCVAVYVFLQYPFFGPNATQTAEAAQIGQIVRATQTAAFNQTQAAIINQRDTDGDGLTDTQETQWGTDPNNPDSDRDRLLDGDEVKRYRTDPKNGDTDRDGLSDGAEVLDKRTDPLNPDSDGDGILDGVDLDPFDRDNPSITQTRLAAIPTVTRTVVTVTATPTLTRTPTPPATRVSSPTPVPALNLGWIGFESNRTGNPEIFSVNTANNGISQLTISAGVDTQPALSLDGRRIAFVSNRDGGNDIFVMNSDGTAVVNLTHDPADDRFPTWSPDGQWIAFNSNRSGDQELYVMRSDGTELRNLTNFPTGEDYQPNWFLDQRGLTEPVEKILFTSNREGNQDIYSIRPDGSELNNLTRSPGNDFSPIGSPDGNSIAFVSNRDGNMELYVMNSNGSSQIRLTDNPAEDTSPSWSPDNRWIAFTSNRTGNDEIFVMRVNGTVIFNLTNNPATDQFPAWH
jgi:TolB protein